MTRNQRLRVLALLLAAGCQAESLDTSTSMVTPADPASAVAALQQLERSMGNISAVLNENEAAVVAATQQLPLGELELKDSSDLEEYRESLAAFFGPLVQAVRDGRFSATAELGIPGPLLCALDGRQTDDPIFAQCVQAVAAVDVRAFVGFVDGGFAIEIRYGGHDGAPVSTPIAITLDGESLRAEIDLGQGLAGVDILSKLLAGGLGLDLGVKVNDLARLNGQISTEFTVDETGISFLVDLRESITVQAPEGTFFSMEKATAGPFFSLRLNADESIAIDVNVGHVSASAPVGALGLDKQFTGTASLDWKGLAYHADGASAASLAFRADVGDLRLDNVTPEATTTILGLRITSGTVRGTAEGFHRRRFHVPTGFQTAYANRVELVSTHLGRSSTRTIAAGSRVIDFRMSLAAKTDALARLVGANLVATWSVELAKVNSLQCATEGTMSLTVAGDDPSQIGQSLLVGEDQDDACIVGYFTKDDAGTAHYNYATQ